MAATQLILDDAKAKLDKVEEGIATLQAKYLDCLAKRDELDTKCQLCECRLVRADKVRDTASSSNLTASFSFMLSVVCTGCKLLMKFCVCVCVFS